MLVYILLYFSPSFLLRCYTGCGSRSLRSRCCCCTTHTSRSWMPVLFVACVRVFIYLSSSYYVQSARLYIYTIYIDRYLFFCLKWGFLFFCFFVFSRVCFSLSRFFFIFLHHLRTLHHLCLFGFFFSPTCFLWSGYYAIYREIKGPLNIMNSNQR